MNISYNIHNLLKIKIENASWHLVKDLNFRYYYFENSGTYPLDILVKIGPFKPNLKSCYCLDRKFYIKKNYIYLRDLDKNLRWEAEIFDVEKEFLKINFNHDFKNYFSFPWCLFPDLIMELYILQPLIEWRLSLKECLLLHAGAVCRDGKAILLAGRGGSRKTQLVIDLMQKGFNLISDDMVILNGTQVLSLPLSLGLFTFCYTKLEKEDLSFFDKIRLLNFLLKKDNKKLQITNSAILDKIFIIFSTQKDMPSIKDLDRKKAIGHLIWNQRMEKTSYVSYKYIIGSFLNAYEYVFPEVSFSAPLDKLEEKLLKDMINNKIITKVVELPEGQSNFPLLCERN